MVADMPLRGPRPWQSPLKRSKRIDPNFSTLLESLVYGAYEGLEDRIYRLLGYFGFFCDLRNELCLGHGNTLLKIDGIWSYEPYGSGFDISVRRYYMVSLLAPGKLRDVVTRDPVSTQNDCTEMDYELSCA
jgi:hypothetical protein